MCTDPQIVTRKIEKTFSKREREEKTWEREIDTERSIFIHFVEIKYKILCIATQLSDYTHGTETLKSV